jgi:hypothetical protein
MSENLKIAQELGIENAEALTASQLKKAIEGAQAKAERLIALQTAAEELGITSEGLSEEDLNTAVGTALDEKLAKELAEQSAAASEEVLEMLRTFLIYQ